MKTLEQVSNEDVAHLAVWAPRVDVLQWLENYFVGRGFRRVAPKDELHFLLEVDWQSPFEPPPKWRAFAVLKEEDGFTTVVDELDRLDPTLALHLSTHAPAIAIKGFFATGEYHYWFLDGGQVVQESAWPPFIASLVAALRTNTNHVTRLPYDEIFLRAEQLYEDGDLSVVPFRNNGT